MTITDALYEPVTWWAMFVALCYVAWLIIGPDDAEHEARNKSGPADPKQTSEAGEHDTTQHEGSINERSIA